MKYIRQVGIIILISFIGELLHFLIPLPVPASIYGLVIMLVCLVSGIIKVSDVKETSSFLIDVVVSLVTVMAVSGRVTQSVIRRGKRK